MFDINKFPIFILSTPRSGSTALGEIIAKKYNIIFFCEPDENKTIDKVINYPDDQYVLKFHTKSIIKYPNIIISKIKNNNCFLIRIRRKDLVAQIASNYLALVRNIWGYNKETVINEDLIDIDYKLVDISIKTIFSYNNIANLNFNYDMDLYYEDIIDIINTGDQIETPKPFNYDKLKDIIKEKL